MCQVTARSIAIPTRLRNYQNVIEAPSEFDVLCGSKSTAFNNHPGNHLFRQKVQSLLAAYENSRTKQQKMKINRQIVQFMRTKFGSRFLKQNKDRTWAIAEEQSVRDKVSHALRYAQLQKEKEQREKDDEAVSEPPPLVIPEPIPYIPDPLPFSSSGLKNFDGDSQSVLIDELHRRQLSILGVLLSEQTREELALGDNLDESLSGLSNNE